MEFDYILNGEWVPSITSVTSFIIDRFLLSGEKVGIEEANRITKKQLPVERIFMSC